MDDATTKYVVMNEHDNDIIMMPFSCPHSVEIAEMLSSLSQRVTLLCREKRTYR